MAKKASIKDIASKVGVSIALVSYVLNGLEKEKRVGPELAKKIRQAAKELNYKPNQIARSLRKGSTNTIGLIVADISNHFFGLLARVIEDEAARLGYTVIFGSSDENYSKSAVLIETLLNRQVDGLIISPSERSARQIKSLMQQNIPVVLIDRYLPGISTSRIVIDNYRATYNATKCFISKGHKKIALIAYRSSLVHMQERVRGYVEAMKDHGIIYEVMVKEIRYSHTKSDVRKVMDELLKEKMVDALLFATNTLAISGLYFIQKYKIQVPRDLAIISFDKHEAFDFFSPKLTYIQQPIEAMGKESVRVLLEQINGSAETVHIELKHRLIERESTG